MTIKEFEAQLKEIDPKFEIVQHPTNTELAGVYYDRNEENKTGFVVTVPSQTIEEKRNPNYVDSTGHPHNWTEKVLAVVKDHLERMKEPEYNKMFYAKLPTR